MGLHRAARVQTCTRDTKECIFHQCCQGVGFHPIIRIFEHQFCFISICKLGIFGFFFYLYFHKVQYFPFLRIWGMFLRIYCQKIIMAALFHSDSYMYYDHGRAILIYSCYSTTTYCTCSLINGDTHNIYS